MALEMRMFSVSQRQEAMDEPVDLMYFCPISALYEKIYPRNINYMPVVNFFVCLDLEQKSY